MLTVISKNLINSIFTLKKLNFDGLVKSRFCPFLSFPRRRESSYFNRFWIPAFTGMTVFRLFTTSSIFTNKKSNAIDQELLIFFIISLDFSRCFT